MCVCLELLILVNYVGTKELILAGEFWNRQGAQ